MAHSSTLLDMWYRKRHPWLSLLLMPLSMLFRGIIIVRRACLQKKTKIRRLPVPVIIIGNINLGGSGKSPLLIAVAKHLREMGHSPGIISRGYGGRAPFYPFTVTAETLPAVGGDEPVMIARRSGCPVVIDSKRFNAARRLIESTGCNLVLSDDGLQHYRLPRDLEIVVVDGERGLGNGRLLPAGPLREPASRLKEADLLVVNGTARGEVFGAELEGKAHQMSLRPAAWHSLNSEDTVTLPQLPWPAATRVHAVAGIGNPQRFFNTLRDLGLDLIPHSFPDHHEFQFGDLIFPDELPVIMTEKDAVKCSALVQSEAVAQAGRRYWYLSVSAELDQDFYAALEERLAKFHQMAESLEPA